MLAVYLALFAFGLSAKEAADVRATVPSLPVVTTWGELGKLPPTILADGSEVRLGIQALEGPAGSAVAFYVLTAQNTPLYEGAGGELCGPVGVKIDDQLTREVPTCNMRMRADENERLELYARLVPLRQPGPVEITIFAQQDMVIGKVTITAHENSYQCWSSIRLDPDTEAETEFHLNTSGNVGIHERIELGPAFFAVPDVPGDSPWSSIRIPLLRDILSGIASDLTLPIPEPASPHPLLHADVDATGVTLTFPVRFLSSWYGSAPNNHILVRWWKDGQPWSSVTSALSDCSLGAFRTVEPYDAEENIHYALTMIADDWPTEKIEVQFLLSPGGYSVLDESLDWIGSASASSDFHDDLAAPGPGVYLSQRITLLPQ